jgi:thioester reductase-like protein
VLLAGATSFLGAFLVKAFLDGTDAELACLVPAGSEDDPAALLGAALARYGSVADAERARLDAVACDLAAPRLGLAPERWGALAEDRDLVVHAGIEANFLLSYGALAPQNVRGTVELLRLACAGRPKAFHFLSSLTVLAGRDGELAEDDALESVPVFPGGYAQTRWVAERLVRAAIARGLAGAIHRPGRIVGARASGATDADDLFPRLVRGLAELGSAPRIALELDATPVDEVARAVVALAQKGLPRGETYHLASGAPLAFTTVLERLAARGLVRSAIDEQAWREELLAHAARRPDGALFPLLPLLRDAARSAAPIVQRERTLAALAGSGVTLGAVGPEDVDRQLDWLARHGGLRAAAADLRA